MSTSSNTSCALVIGGTSAIGQALIRRLLDHSGYCGVHVLSRKPQPTELPHGKLHWHKGGYSADALAAFTASIPGDGDSISRVFICNGVLHDDQQGPERRLEDLDGQVFLSRIQSNTLVPLLILQALLPLLCHNKAKACIIAVCSARIGSITDNRLGGWYSYRASKAALNMVLKTASIELARRASHLKLLSFHPGTTDSPLSAPFQRNVPPGKLFSADFVAQQLLDLCSQLPLDGKLSFLDWQGKAIDW